MDMITAARRLIETMGKDPDLDEALRVGVMAILDAMKCPTPVGRGRKPSEEKKPEPKDAALKQQEKTTPETGRTKRPGRPKSFDAGKAVACRKAGWGIDKIADELGVSATTIRNYFKKEGIT